MSVAPWSWGRVQYWPAVTYGVAQVPPDWAQKVTWAPPGWVMVIPPGAVPARRDDQGAGQAGRGRDRRGGGGGDFADGVVGVVGDVQVACRVEGDALGVAHQRRRWPGRRRRSSRWHRWRCRPRCTRRRRSSTGPTACRKRRRSPGSGCSARRRCTGPRRRRSRCSARHPDPRPWRGRRPRLTPTGPAGDRVDVIGGHRLAPLDMSDGGDFLHPVVAAVADVQVPGRVERQAAQRHTSARRWPGRRLRSCRGSPVALPATV